LSTVFSKIKSRATLKISPWFAKVLDPTSSNSGRLRCISVNCNRLRGQLLLELVSYRFSQLSKYIHRYRLHAGKTPPPILNAFLFTRDPYHPPLVRSFFARMDLIFRRKAPQVRETFRSFSSFNQSMSWAFFIFPPPTPPP